MHPELEVLLAAWTAYTEASGDLAERRLAVYQSRCEDAALAAGVPVAQLDAAVRAKSRRIAWLESRAATILPPKA